jgi:hypothetical protein
MAAIGTGQGLLNTIDRAIEQIENDTASREDFLQELDAQVSSSVPEEGWGPEDTTGPLLQAGAWMAGIHTVAKSVQRSGNAEAADRLLRRPDVTEFFLKYISSREGEEKMGPIHHAVHEALKDLDAVAQRQDIGLEGAAEAEKITADLMQLL